MDGLVLTQSRIATPDGYVLCLMLGAVYFLLKRNWLVSGLFLGATAACKWIGAFTVIPILLYFSWTSFRVWREAEDDKGLREAERVMIVGAAGVLLGIAAFIAVYLIKGQLEKLGVIAMAIPLFLGLFIILGGIFAILTDARLRKLPRAQVYIRTAWSFPLYFILVPGMVYIASYIPMLSHGHGLQHIWDFNKSAYEFHSSLTATHPYQSKFFTWLLDYRPVFFYLGSGEAKIYNLGNPMIFWMSIPALLFCAWQAVRNIRLRIEPGSIVRAWGRLSEEQWVLAFVVLCYLGFWLALFTQGRALFMYHYQEAFAFSVLALGYVIGWLWKHPNSLGKYAVIAYLGVVGATFIYFYPHWTAVDVPQWLDSSYYWFDSWR